MTDFIEVYDDALDAALCRRIIDKFDASPAVVRGRTAGGVDIGRKDSHDIEITSQPDWQPLVGQVLANLSGHIMAYMRKYAFTVVGTISSSIEDPRTGEKRELGHEDIPGLDDASMGSIIMHKYRLGPMSAQKYLQGTGGYHQWHSEHCPHDASCETLHRVLFYIYYLNDVVEGGETEFYYQGRAVEPRTGRLVIAPAAFTHTHKGNVPVSGDKYILTSWVMFHRVENILAAR